MVHLSTSATTGVDTVEKTSPEGAKLEMDKANWIGEFDIFDVSDVSSLRLLIDFDPDFIKIKVARASLTPVCTHMRTYSINVTYV